MRLGTRSLRASAAMASVVGGASGTLERGGPRKGGRPPLGRPPALPGRGAELRAGGGCDAAMGAGAGEEVALGVGVTGFTVEGVGVTGADPLRIT